MIGLRGSGGEVASAAPRLSCISQASTASSAVSVLCLGVMLVLPFFVYVLSGRRRGIFRLSALGCIFLFSVLFPSPLMLLLLLLLSRCRFPSRRCAAS